MHVNQAVLLSERRLSYLETSRAESLELLRLATALTEDMAKAVCEFNGAHKKFSRLSENCQAKLRQIAGHLDDISGLDVRTAAILSSCSLLLPSRTCPPQPLPSLFANHYLHLLSSSSVYTSYRQVNREMFTMRN